MRSESGAGGTGFASFEFDFQWKIVVCGGKIRIATRMLAGTMRFSDTYFVDGTSYPVPKDWHPSVDDQADVVGAVVTKDGQTIGTFKDTASTTSPNSTTVSATMSKSHRCLTV